MRHNVLLCLPKLLVLPQELRRILNEDRSRSGIRRDFPQLPEFPELCLDFLFQRRISDETF